MSVFAPYGKIPGAWPTGITQSRGPNGSYLVPYDPYYNMRGESGFFHDTALGSHEPPTGFYERLHQDRLASERSSPFWGMASPALSWLQRWRLKKQLRGLGAIPTDFELAKVMGYTPVESGWIATKQGYLTPPWLPPNGYAQGGYPTPVQPNDGGGEPMSPTAIRFQSDGYFDKYYGLGQIVETTPATTVASVEDVVAVMNAHNDRIFALSLVSTAAVAVGAIITIFRTLKLIREGGGE